MAKLTLSFKDKKLKIYPLSGDEAVIGRSPECAIHIDSLAVEPEHARIQRQGNHYQLTALGDQHEINVNGVSAAAHELNDGDVIQVGKHTLNFSLEAGGTFVGQAEHVLRQPAIGWLQILNGSHLGRTIRLDKAMTRVGKSHVAVAVIVRRDSGYFLSHLEGDTPPTVNDQPLNNETWGLRNGDQIRIGTLQLQFFVEEQAAAPQAVVEKGPDEQRDFSRIHFEVPATLHSGGQHWEARLSDISLHGALVERPADWEAGEGQVYRLDVHLNEEITIHMDVEVAHADARWIGFRCHDIDVDSITHLRRLVELNLGDPDLVERELSALG
jgi:pSer/pThr/pTyr-binding forkhead associated (FHA) protein